MPWPESPADEQSAVAEATPDTAATSGPRNDAAPGPARVAPDSAAARIVAGIAQIIVLGTITLVAGIMAYRNYRLGRCDLRRATRLGLAIFALSFLAVMLNVDVAPLTMRALIGPFPIYSIGLGSALVLMACYIAAEPLARSRWPTSLVSWNRLFGGNFSDPMIGRDVLIGLLVGAVMTLIAALAQFAAPVAASVIGPDVGLPTANSVQFAFEGTTTMLAQCTSRIAIGLINAPAVALLVLIVMVLLGFLRIKSRWPAIVVVILLILAQTFVVPNVGPLDRIGFAFGAALLLITLDRFGLLATATTFASATIYDYFLNAAPYNEWWATAALLPGVLIAAALLYAFRTSTAGKSLFAPTATR